MICTLRPYILSVSLRLVFRKNSRNMSFFNSFDKRTIVGKRVVITGASSGIGEAVAKKYAEFGATIFIAARRENELARVVGECEKLTPIPDKAKFGYVRGDMANMDDTKKVVDEALKFMGGIDILFLNHAYLVAPPTWEGTDENLRLYDHNYNVNTRSYVHLVAHAYNALVESKGNILVVGSVSGKVGYEFVAEYCSSKFALEGFFSSIREEFKVREVPITITQAVLGYVDTPPCRKMFEDQNAQPPYGYIQPEEVAVEVIKAVSKGQRELELLKPYGFGKMLLKLYPLFPNFVHKFHL